MPSEFRVDLEPLARNRALLSVHGDLDVATARSFKQALLEVIEDGTDGVVVDLAGTTFIDSSGLAVLLTGVKRLRPRERRLVLVTTNPSIAHSLEIIGLIDVLPIYTSRDAAVTGLDGQA
jgi:anti-sigma B factor antagonist